MRGLRHEQLEPVFGGKSGVVAERRVTCAHALVGSDIEGDRLLEVFVDRLADPMPRARQTVRAVPALDVSASILLLRLKALDGDREPEVIGERLCAILRGRLGESVPFVERFLHSQIDGASLEAATALAESRDPMAFAATQRFWNGDVAGRRDAASCMRAEARRFRP